MWVMPSWASARPTWVGFDFVDLAAALRGMEIVPAPIGIERPEQAVAGDRLAEPEKARHRSFLLDQDRRIDRPCRIVERDDQVELAIRADPAVGRAVLEQQHAGQRPTLALLAVGAPPLRLLHQPPRRSDSRVTV